jgi:hypothetical protein
MYLTVLRRRAFLWLFISLALTAIAVVPAVHTRMVAAGSLATVPEFSSLVGGDDTALTSIAGLAGSDTGFDAFEPAIAFNPVTNQYLVVFSADGIDRPDSEFEIYGQFVDAATGANVGDIFRISHIGNDTPDPDRPNAVDVWDAFSPDVAYSTADNAFLVTWVADNTNPIIDAETGERAGLNDRYNFEVYVQTVAADGTLLNQGLNTVNADGPRDDRISDIVAFASRQEFGGDSPDWDAFSPSVAYNSDEDEFLICWSSDKTSLAAPEAQTGGAYEIDCQRFSIDAGQIGNDTTISSMGPGYATGEAYLLYDAYTPDVVYNPTDQEYLVVWAGDQTQPNALVDNEFEIFGQLLEIDTNGDLVEKGRNDARISRMGTQANNTDPDYDAYRPAVAYNPDRNQYMVVWTGDSDGSTGEPVNDKFEIWAAIREGGSLTLSSPNDATLQFLVSAVPNAGQSQFKGLAPDVTYVAASEEWLVTWRADPAPNNDQFYSFARRIDAATPDDSTYAVDDTALPPVKSDQLPLGTTPAIAPDFFSSSQLGGSVLEPRGEPSSEGQPENMHRAGPRVAANSNGGALVVWAGAEQPDQVDIRARRLETIAPALLVSPDLEVEATSAQGATVNYQALGADSAGSPLQPTCAPLSGTTFPFGTTTVECSVTDGVNTTDASFTVTVQDTTAPAITVPEGGVDADAGAATDVVVNYSASAADLVDGAVDVECLPASGSQFPAGTTNVVCNAVDSAGNSGQVSFEVRVASDVATPTPSPSPSPEPPDPAPDQFDLNLPLVVR